MPPLLAKRRKRTGTCESKAASVLVSFQCSSFQSVSYVFCSIKFQTTSGEVTIEVVDEIVHATYVERHMRIASVEAPGSVGFVIYQGGP